MAALASVDNRQCVSCHADLQTIGLDSAPNGLPSIFQKRVTDFVTDHPQFAVSTPSTSKKEHRIRLDPAALDSEAIAEFQGRIKLNHRKHLQTPLEGSDEKLVQLDCQSCHRPAPDGGLMVPITFAAHCADCHNRDLRIDSTVDSKELAGCRVPHGSVEKVRDYLEIVLATSQCQPFPSPEREPRLLATRPKPVLPDSLRAKLNATEEGLFRDKCTQCHTIERPPEALPKVIGSKIPDRWFRYALFNHRAHRMLDCVQCHHDSRKTDRDGKLVTARTSDATEDVLIPGIDVCRACHQKSGNSGASQQASAPTNCASCHLYHDKSADAWKGKRTIDLRINRQENQ
jgi:hypothetical protein